MSYTSYNGGRRPPNSGLDELKRAYEQFKRQFGGQFQGQFGWFGIAIGILIAVVIILGSFYTVEPNEEAVVIRLGKYSETTPPGLHFKLPLGIDRIFKLKTKLVLQEEFGFRTTQMSNNRSDYSKQEYLSESHMLTGDLNVADVEWIVQYQISDPMKFLFQARDPQRNIRDVSESIMRRVVGDRLVNDVLTTGRVEIADQAKLLMQEVLDKYDIGVSIKTVKLQDVNPPESVKPSFNDVNAAKQEQEKLINIAEKAYNEIIPEARGKAEETISKAEGYAAALVNRAEGDAAKFNQMYTEYRLAPDITRKRIYLETMETLFKRFSKLTIVDSNVKGLLPVFGKNSSVKE